MTTASSAIIESIRTDSIVTLRLESAAHLTSVRSELQAECDDSVEQPGPRGSMTAEYWGADDDGNTWRVHVQTTETYDDGYGD